MRTIEYLSDPDIAGLYWPAVIVACLVALVGAPLSVLVVTKRLAFIGQGVSHSAFLGVGLALTLSAAGFEAAGSGVGLIFLVALVAVLSALGIAWLGERGGINTDTAIGIVLAAAMAGGFLLQSVAGSVRADRVARGEVVDALPSLESMLFGSVLSVSWGEVFGAAVVVLVIGVCLVARRRSIVFWAFDESVCPAFGVRSRAIRYLVMLLLAGAVVLTTRVAGIVLATALLVLPGAIALAVSDRLTRVLVIALVSALLGVLAGIVVSFEFDLQPGPSIVLVMTGLYAVARCLPGPRGGSGTT